MGKSVPTGPSTSAEPNRGAREPTRLTRPKFAMRLFARVRLCFGLQLDEAWLHDLIKDALVPGAERGPNEGLRPVYTYGFRSYRRALQIARLRRDGFVERDGIRIQLFLKGYGEQDIRQALWKQYCKYFKTTLAKVRSGYIDNWKPIPDGHKSSLRKTMEPLDPRFTEAGLQLSDDSLISFFRTAKQEFADTAPGIDVTGLMQQLIDRGRDFEWLARSMKRIFSGILMFGEKEDKNTNEPDPIEGLIIRANDKEYAKARDFYRLIISRPAAQFLSNVAVGESAEAMQKVWKALRACLSAPSRPNPICTSEDHAGPPGTAGCEGVDVDQGASGAA